MNLLPDWAPNVHPLLVHFPIVLLMLAVLLDFGALLWRKRSDTLHFAAVLVFVLGGISVIITLLTGRAAADGILLPAAANAVLTDHADWAERTAWFFGLYGLLRLGVLWRNPTGPARRGLWWSLFLIGAVGLVLVQQTAERGAKMVYLHGVGVAAVSTEETRPHDHETDHEEGTDHEEMDHEEMDHEGTDHEEMDHEEAHGAGALATEANGGWRWTAGAGLPDAFQFLQGQPTDLTVRTTREGERTILALNVTAPVFFVLPKPLQHVQVDLRLNTGQFEGTVDIAHHVRDAQNYDFLTLEPNTLRQGRLHDGQATVFDEAPATTGGWVVLRAVSDKTHFRGYLGEQMLTHGHGDAPEPGSTGLRLTGTGTVLLDYLAVQPLRAGAEEAPEHAGEHEHSHEN